MVRLTQDERWAPLIGQFALSFGSVEHSINEMIIEYCEASKPIISFLKQQALKRKVDLLKQVLPTLKLIDPKDVRRRLEILGRVENLARERNIILHNPLHFNVLAFSKGNAMERIGSMTNGPYEKFVSFEDLERHCKEAHELAVQLEVAVSDYRFAKKHAVKAWKTFRAEGQ